MRILLLSVLFNTCYFLPFFYVLNHSHLWQWRGSLSFGKHFLITNDMNLFVFLMAIFIFLKNPLPSPMCVYVCEIESFKCWCFLLYSLTYRFDPYCWTWSRNIDSPLKTLSQPAVYIYMYTLCVEVRAQLEEVGSLFVSCGPWGSNLGHQALRQTLSLLTSP